MGQSGSRGFHYLLLESAMCQTPESNVKENLQVEGKEERYPKWGVRGKGPDVRMRWEKSERSVWTEHM